MADENKRLLGLLNGIVRCEYYGEQDITEDYLKEQLYTDLSSEEFAAIITKTRNMIKNMASADMDMGQLEAFLTSRMKKKDGGITEEQAKVYGKFWKNHRSRIHDAIVSRCQWNRSLHSMNWRIDIKTQTRQQAQISCPTAILELQLTEPLNKEKEKDVVRFEMDEEGLSKVLGHLKTIESQIQKHCS